MSKSNRRRDQENKVAQWLSDAYGEDGETEVDFRRDARDFIKFMEANGWALRPTAVAARKEVPF